MHPQAAGAPRKTLEAQIDRLDKILDGLADALEQAVTTAVKEAAGQAVRDAVTEVALKERGSIRRTPHPISLRWLALLNWIWWVQRMARRNLRGIWTLRLPALLLLLGVLSVSLTSHYLGSAAAGVAAGLLGVVLVVSVWIARPAGKEPGRLPSESPTPSENGDRLRHGLP